MFAGGATTWTGPAAAGAIRLYQRWISPHKGYRCAYRAVHGRRSCSEFGRRVVLKRGLVGMLPLLPLRFAACGRAAALARERRPVIDYQGLPPPVRPPTRPRDLPPPSSCDGLARPDPCDAMLTETALEVACQCLPDLLCAVMHH